MARRPRHKCHGKKRDGSSCKMPALQNSRRCFVHSKDPTIQAKRKAATSKGGRAYRVRPASVPADMKTVEQLRGHLEQELANVQQLAISLRRATAVARLVREAARLIELAEMRDRIEALAEQLGVNV